MKKLATLDDIDMILDDLTKLRFDIMDTVDEYLKRKLENLEKSFTTSDDFYRLYGALDFALFMGVIGKGYYYAIRDKARDIWDRFQTAAVPELVNPCGDE